MSNIQPGFFPSPITAQSVTQSSLRFNELRCSDSEVYALIADPSKGGRSTVFALNSQTELIDESYNARSLVHEYGGGSLYVKDEYIFFINYSDQGIYKVIDGSVELIYKDKGLRFSDLVLDGTNENLYAVVEDHNKDPVENYLAQINIENSHLEVVHRGYDFYISPRISPDGKRLVWITWSHPNMAWDETFVFHANLEGGKHSEPKIIHHQAQVSIIEPEFSPENELYFVSDQNGYWQIFHETTGCICTFEADFAAPSWILGIKSYCFYDHNTIVGRYTKEAKDTLYTLDLKANTLEPIDLPYSQIEQITANKSGCTFFATSDTKAQAIVNIDLTTKRSQTLKKSQDQIITDQWISKPQAITYPSSNNEIGHGFYYPPTNPNHSSQSPSPLIVKCHGGPTHHFCPIFTMGVQFFTSRGYSYLFLNYSGSTGYGRAYRDRLKRNWGHADVFDAASSVQTLVEKGLADPNRLFIVGGSAGGFTALAAVAFNDTFSAAVSYYGVSDPKLLAEDTHKMEYHYLDSLIGLYPEEIELYNKVSALVHVDKIKVPVLLLQGDEDRVVPKEQSEIIYKKLKERGIETSYILFKGEAHGFRQKENIEASLEAELRFYQNVN
jgi:dipeptidyl aminopeptidase/acylaminoacyl peptidase